MLRLEPNIFLDMHPAPTCKRQPATSASTVPQPHNNNSLGIAITCGLTDNGSCYKAFTFSDNCQHLGLRYIRTRLFAPRTHGKAERFINTMLTE